MANKGDKHQRARGFLARPLDSLFFLLPLIVLFEIACLTLDTSGLNVNRERVVAYQLLQVFFELFGASGLLLPPLAVIVILLATHVYSREPWAFHKKTVALMYVEAVVWSLPLLGINQFTQMSAIDGPVRSWIADFAICVGAGIYEELVFRLGLISLIVMIGADLFRFSYGSTLVAGVLLSAGMFALHHHPPLGSEPYDAFRFSFRALAGVYLGVIFVFRGYGPAAGAHIAYNLIVISFNR